MVSGIFYSKLMYCLPVFGNVHGLAIYRDTRGRSAGMTMNEWGGLTEEIPDYSLETSRAGFVFRGGRLYNSVSRNLREEMSISKFKEGAKKWVREQIPVKPRR